MSDAAAAWAPLDHRTHDHLHRLVASWSLLSDLSFSDLLLVTVREGADGPRLVVLAQVRPNNRTTLLAEDLLGSLQPASRWPEALEAMATGRLVATSGPEVTRWAIPVGLGTETVAVVLRLQSTPRGPASPFEPAYLAVFERMCAMVADGTFPFRDADVAAAGLPRVGDGLLVLDAAGRCEFATPNAVSALHRLGAHLAPDGLTLEQVGIRAAAPRLALQEGRPVVEELDGPGAVSIMIHAVPLLASGSTTGAVALVRDVTDLRELGRLVIVKEASIREVHHRVKNNLQTISSLLRLQARRADTEESRQALSEAERRIRAIAAVHEILAKEGGDQVPFDSIVGSLVEMAEDAVLSSGPVEFTVSGSLGELPADVATPLAVVLAELLMNAVEHGFLTARGAHGVDAVGHVWVTLSTSEQSVSVEVRDNGEGLPEGFDLASTSSLGLSIVRDLVASQLAGQITARSLSADQGGGTSMLVVVPADAAR